MLVRIPYVASLTPVLSPRIGNTYSPAVEIATTYSALKAVHLTFAALTISGFVLRGYWMMRGSALLDARAVRVLPHLADTVFLLSGIGLVLTLRLELLANGWLLAKLAALVAYVVLGAIALRRGRTLRIRLVAFVLALMAFGYIVGAALARSPASWFA